MYLGHLSAYLQTVNISLSLHVVVSQTITNRSRLSARQLKCLLIKLRGISISLFFLSNKPHQLLSLAARTVLFQQLPQDVFGIVKLFDLNIRFSVKQPGLF